MMKTETFPPGDGYTIAESMPRNLICFSHLRWDFVYQRPQHILSRLAKICRIYFIEEPVFGASHPHYEIREVASNIIIVVPQLMEGIDHETYTRLQKELLDDFVQTNVSGEYISWYYTPMALQFSAHLKPEIIVYDCMDELSAFKFAPPQLKELEKNLLEKADIVFTGGHALYNAKKGQHHNIHAFPSSVDKKHFGRARSITTTPGDQSRIAAPRIGFFGVIDERFDIDLIKGVAEKQPDWHLILLGPVVKIDPATLPQANNIHYLGSKSYAELPDYISGWDIAMIPFQLNESTAFISPTKTPEYLSAGVPVISTPIADVINPYGTQGLVQIVSSADEFIDAANNILNKKTADREWLQKVDIFLSNDSWDNTVNQMMKKIEQVAQKKIATA